MAVSLLDDPNLLNVPGLMPRLDFSGQDQLTLEQMLLARERNRISPVNPRTAEDERLDYLQSTIDHTIKLNEGQPEVVSGTQPSSLTDNLNATASGVANMTNQMLEGATDLASNIGSAVYNAVPSVMDRAAEIVDPAHNPVLRTAGAYGEVVRQLGTGLATMVPSGLLSLSSFMNRTAEDVARRGPLPVAGIPEEEQVEMMRPGVLEAEKTQKEYGYTPTTEMARQTGEAISTVLNLPSKFADYSEDAVIALGGTQQQARNVGAAVEIIGFAAGDNLFRSSVRGIRSKIADVNTKLRAAESNPKLVNEVSQSAQELMEIVNDNPQIKTALDEARIRDSQKTSITPEAPVESTPAIVPEAPVEATIPPEVTPAPISATPVETPIAPIVETPLTAAPIISDINAKIAKLNDPNLTIGDGNRLLSDIKADAVEAGNGNLQVGLAKLGLDPDTISMLTPELKRVPARKAQVETPTTTIPEGEMVVKPSSVETSTATPEAPVATPRALPTNLANRLELINDPNTAPEVRTRLLAEVKAEARANLGQFDSTKKGLLQLGLDEQQVIALEPQLKTVRAKKAVEEVTPTQVETAPIVETPAIPEVVDPTPAVKKPSRKRARKVIETEPEITSETVIPERTNEVVPEGTSFAPRDDRLDSLYRTATNESLPQQIRQQADSDLWQQTARTGVDHEVALQYSGFTPEEITKLYEVRARGTGAPIPKVQPISKEVAAEPTTRQATGPIARRQFSTVQNLNELDNLSDAISSMADKPSSTIAPVQVMYENGKPAGIVINPVGFDTPTSYETIARQAANGDQISKMILSKIEAKAKLFDVTPQEAQRISSQAVLDEATRRAANKNLPVYRQRSGGKLEEIPRDHIETSAKLNDGNINEPKKLTSEQRADYVAEKTRPTGEVSEATILEALEKLEDISDRLPPEVVPWFNQALEMRGRKLKVQERMKYGEIVENIKNLVDPRRNERPASIGSMLSNKRGSIGDYGLTVQQRLAYQNLKHQAVLRGQDIMEFIKGHPTLDTVEKKLFEIYDRSLNNPLEDMQTNRGTINAQMQAIDPEAYARGDRVLQPVEGKVAGTFKPLVYASEQVQLQNAKEMAPNRTLSIRPSEFQIATRSLNDAGLQELNVAHRNTIRASETERQRFHQDLQDLGSNFSADSKRAIGVYGIAQDPRGQSLLKGMGVTPRNLNPQEMAGYKILRNLYESFFERINETRASIGEKPLNYEQNYFTFMRTFNLLEEFDIRPDLVRDVPELVSVRTTQRNMTPFRFEKERVKAGQYPLETDAFKIMAAYGDQAIRNINISPFVAKVEELIDGVRPRLDNAGNEIQAPSFSLQAEKPHLHGYIKEWKNYIAGVDDFYVKNNALRNFLTKSNRMFSSNVIDFNPRSTLIQPTAIIPTYNEVGLKPIMQAFSMHAEDIFTGGKNREFALEHSKILDMRNAQMAQESFVQSITDINVGQVFRRTSQVGSAALRYLDFESAVIGWNSGYKFATDKLKLTGEAAYNFADDVLTRTQGNNLPGDVAPIHRNLVGRSLFPLQKFVVNQWDGLTHDVMGIGNPSITNKEIRTRVARFVVSGMIANAFFEDILGPGLIDPARETLTGTKSKRLFQSPVSSPPMELIREFWKGEASDRELDFARRILESTVGSSMELFPGLSGVQHAQGFFDSTGKIVYDTAKIASGGSGPKAIYKASTSVIPGGRTIYNATSQQLFPEETKGMANLTGMKSLGTLSK